MPNTEQENKFVLCVFFFLAGGTDSGWKETVGDRNKCLEGVMGCKCLSR